MSDMTDIRRQSPKLAVQEALSEYDSLVETAIAAAGEWVAMDIPEGVKPAGVSRTVASSVARKVSSVEVQDNVVFLKITPIQAATQPS